TFRRFDRAHAAIVRGVHVAHFKAGAFTGKTARAKGRDTALVGNLGQRVRLVHELRQLARAEELLDGSRNGLGVDQVVRHEVFGLGLAQTLTHRTLDTNQTGPELVLGEFADTAHPTVAQVID